MSMDATRTALEGYFYQSWTTTPIQYHGVSFTTPSTKKWIGLKFVPVENVLYAFDGTDTGRIEYNAQMQVFCYDTSLSKCIKLADSICTFLNGKRFSPDIVCGIGQVHGAAIDLENGIFECMVTFEASNYA